MSTPAADTCDDCPECKDSANWTTCCASCHCATPEQRCARCRLQADAAELRTAAATVQTHTRATSGSTDWVALMDPDARHALARWLEHMASSCNSKIKAAGLVWPDHTAEADRFIAKGVSGLEHARTLALAINKENRAA